jgi:hypothetical protein
MSRTGRWLLTAIAAGVMTLSACAGHEDPRAEMQQRCTVLRAHVVDLQVANLTVDREKHRAALTRSLGTHYVDDCVSRQSSADVDCAMSARSSAELARCYGHNAEASR